MSDQWRWPGSRWWRVDLHTHSPASYDFRPDAAREEKDWIAWIQSAQSAGLDAVAITDHNSAEAIDPLLSAVTTIGASFAVFPGVELTASDGTHLLFIFDQSCRSEHVADLLSRAEIPVEQRGSNEARSPLSVEQLFEIACEGSSLCVAAHVNGPKGLCSHDGQQRLCELKHQGLCGVEVVPDSPFDESWFDGSRPEIGRRLSRIWASDAHRHDELGQRFTWVKMSQPSIEGLRLAFLDGESSLYPVKSGSPEDPNRHADLAIESITVFDGKYIGRPKELVVGFNPWMTALIGGRGTGKSSLIDFCRQVLRRDAELDAGEGSSLRSTFDRRMQVPSSRNDEGLLTDTTRIELVYRKDGERFRLAWNAAGSVRSIERQDSGSWVTESGEIRDRFPARIYSQKQLFDLARQPNALLSVIDDSSEVQGAENLRRSEEAQAQFLFLCAEARSLRMQAAELPARRAELEDVRRKLDVLQKQGSAEILKEHRSRQKLHTAWQSTRESVSSKLLTVEQAVSDLVVPDLGLTDSESDSAVFALIRAHEQLSTVLEALRKDANTLLEKARIAAENVFSAQDAADWNIAVDGAEARYQGQVRALADAGIPNPDAYGQLLQRAATLEQETARLASSLSKAEEVELQAAEACAEFRSRRSELTERRNAFANRVSGELIRVTIRPKRNRAGLEEYLRSSLGIERFDGDYEAFVKRVDARPGGEWMFSELDALVAEIRDACGNADAPIAAKDKRFASALRKLPPERIDRLALYYPGDEVVVSFHEHGAEAGSWKQLHQGSPGQQTAALLAFVLGYGDEPIILDQPEDDLDNTLIYDLLVRRLRELKPRRQIIVVTHNANIVVHGDSELVVSLASRGGQTKIDFSGGLQEHKAREEVCRVMEGGRTAFESRYRRIMQFGGRS